MKYVATVLIGSIVGIAALLTTFSSPASFGGTGISPLPVSRSSNNTWTGTNAFATTTTGMLNGTVVVNGTFPYTRNSSGVQAALDVCSFLGSACGAVHLTAGTYSITSGVGVPSNILIDGDGYQTDLVESAGINIGITSTSNITLSNLRFDCTGQTTSNDVCLSITNPLGGISVDHTYMTAYHFGIFLTTNATTTEVGKVSITNNYLNGLGNNDVIGGGVSDATSTLSEIIIEGNHIVQNAGINSNYPNAVDMTAQNKTIIENNVIRGWVVVDGEKIRGYHVTAAGNILAPALSLNYGGVRLLSMSNIGETTNASYISFQNNNIFEGNVIVEGQLSPLAKAK